MSITCRVRVLTFLVFFVSINANAASGLWCKWLLKSKSESPFEWIDKTKINLSATDKQEALQKAGPELSKLFELADDVHYFTVQLIFNSKNGYKKAIEEFDKVRINRLTNNSWLGTPFDNIPRRRHRGGRIIIKEKDPEIILYSIHLANKASASSTVYLNRFAVSQEFTAEGQLHEENKKLYKGLPNNEKVMFTAVLRWNKPHFEYILREIQAYPGIKVTRSYFNRFQPMGFVDIEGTKGDMEKLFNSGYTEIMQLENRAELCLKYPELCAK